VSPSDGRKPKARDADRAEAADQRPARRARLADYAATLCWSYLVWTLLTWQFTLEQALFGLGVAIAVAIALTPLGPVAGPWRLLRPAMLLRVARLVGVASVRIVVANARLAARVWSPRLPLRSGMVITPTTQRSAAGLTLVGLVTSLIVENQIVDLDRRRGLLQYHAVAVPGRDAARVRAAVNGPIERLLPVERELPRTDGGDDARERSPE
jgi:multicomponent Na+:H+ antiporter subunit E